MEYKDIFKIVRARQFFPKYAPQVNNWWRKLLGKNTRGNDLDFSELDKQAIQEGFTRMFLCDLTNVTSEIRELKRRIDKAKTHEEKTILKAQLADLILQYHSL